MRYLLFLLSISIAICGTQAKADDFHIAYHLSAIASGITTVQHDQDYPVSVRKEDKAFRSAPNYPDALIRTAFTARYGMLNADIEGYAGSNGVHASQAQIGTVSGKPSSKFKDTITITSSTLPSGTPVKLRVQLKLRGSIELVGTSSDGCAASGYVTVTGPGINNTVLASLSSTGSQTLEVTIQAQVGNTLFLSGGLTSIAHVAGALATPSSKSFKAWFESSVALSVRTPYAGFSSASGWVYPF